MRPWSAMAVVVFALAVCVPPAAAIELGDAAPPLKVKEWVKGSPVDLKDGRGRNVYVIEFWATWCGPCIRGMPHLTKLQKQYADKGLVVVGVTSKDPRQDLEDVRRFVKNMGDRLGYTIAFDDGEATDKAYMEAFRKEGIPQCFVVDKEGRIVWEGHPMFGLDAVLEAIFSGPYDVKKLREVGEKASEAVMRRLQEQAEIVESYFKLVSGAANAEGAREAGEKAFKAIRDDAMMLNDFAWTILTDEDVQTRDLELALRAAKAAMELSEGRDANIVDTYARALFDTGKVKEAVEQQKKAVELSGGRAEFKEALERYQKAAGK